tara:strand:+ start:81 stop:1124 length:1044 start_codon:yes stop_codon:yes gene_type:complete
MSPDELIKEGLKDSELAEERVSDFYSVLVNKEITYAKPLNLNSINSSVYGTIRGFYTKNRVNTQGWTSPQIAIPDVDKTDSEHPLFVLDKKTKKLDLNRELFLRFFRVLNPRDETIALCLMSSGLDISDILDLTIYDIQSQRNQDRIFIQINRLKTGEIAKSFLSKEATRYIRRYIQNYRKDGLEEEKVFINTVENHPVSKRQPDGKPNHHNSIPVSSVDYNFKRAVREKMGIKVRLGKQSPLRPKRLRKCFKSGCTRAGLDLDMVRVFMGQKSAISKVYLGKSREELEVYYSQVEPFLTVVKDIETLDELETVQNENVELKREILKMRSDISDLQNKIYNDIIQNQ